MSTTAEDRRRVLLVDDEIDLHELVLFNLDEAGFDARAVATAGEAFDVATTWAPSVVILDLMLPDASGIDLCRRLRADDATRDLGIVMLTARSEEFDRVLGFEVGADDYVVKPFSVKELVMRTRVLARHVDERRLARLVVDNGNRLRWRGLSVDTRRQQAYVDGTEIPLRPLEMKLLVLLLENPQRTFSRAELLTEVWDLSPETSTRTVDTHIHRLRERLGACGDAVETVHGRGYRLRSVVP